MPLLFVCETFARSGKDHHFLRSFPFIARGSVKGSLFEKGSAWYLRGEGEDSVFGEIYEIPQEYWDAFLSLVNGESKSYAFLKKNACVHGKEVECFCLCRT